MPYLFLDDTAAGGGGVTRQTYFAESNGASTTSSTSYQDKTTLTFTPDDNSDYFIFCSALVSKDSTTTDVLVKLINNAGTTIGLEANIELKDLTDYFSVGCVVRQSFTTGHGSQDFKIQYANETSATAAIKEARILALRADAADQYAESAGTSATTSASEQDKTTLTFTPASGGDYIIVASAQIKSSATSAVTGVTLDIGGTNYGKMSTQFADATSWIPWVAVKRVNLAASSQSIKIQYNSNGSATASIRNAAIVALRADAFQANYYAEDTGADTHTGAGSNSYGDGASLTETPAAKEHIIFASAVFDVDSNSDSAGVQFLEGATNKGESLREPQSTASSPNFSYFTVYRATLAASSTTWKFQYKTTDTSQTVTIDEQAIAVIQTEG